MYPTISDLIKDIFGWNIPLPIQSFGFMLAISFLAAAYTLQLELQRKEKNGLLRTFTRQVTKGEPAKMSELISTFLIGFVLGYKLIYAFLNYSDFVADTQAVLLSLQGSWPGGLALGGIMAYMQYREKEKEKLPEPVTETEVVHPYQMVSNITIVAAVSGIIGAKIFHNLENLHEFAVDPVDALLSFSGLTMYGGLIVGAITVMRYGKKMGIPPLVLSDATAPGLMLAYGTGRFGCQLSGDGDWGIVNHLQKPGWLSWAPDWVWAYNYPNNVVNDGIPIPGCEGPHCYMLPDAVFPTPLYEAVTCILLFVVLWSLRKKLQRTGQVFFLYLLLNGIERFFIEKIRVNNKFDLLGMQVTQAEVIASLLMLGGAIGLFIVSRQKNETNGTVTGSM
jgi:phosphatidylglycerol---prolipoprotein diacylglyceryl transferase